MIRALALAFAQLGDPAILRVLAKSLLLTLALLAVLGGGAWYGLLRLEAAWHLADAGWLAGLGAVALAVVGGWLFFRAIAVAVIQLFGDEIVRAVERRYYPAAVASERRVPIGTALALGAGSATRALLVNLAVLPLYLVLLITGVGTPILFVAVNAWLLGHDLAELAGARHLDRRELRAWKRETRNQRLLLGLIVAGLFLVPFANLLAPIVGAAMATHLFHARRTP